jgi:uncharacterized protein GlcG (DUF336 family)
MDRIRGIDTKKVVDAATKKAIDLDVNVCIAVVDDGGHLQAFLRMDKAILAAIDISQKKAKTAAYFGFNSELLGEGSQPGGPFYGVEISNGGLITFSGGVPLKDSAGEVCGAIGVSGGQPDQDAAIAQAGAVVLAL